MKKYLMMGFAAIAIASCMNHDFETYTPEQAVKAEYDAKFVAEFGQPGSQQNWGFDTSTRAFTRSMATPAVADYTPIYDEAWVANYLPTAKEPTAENANDNADNGYYEEGENAVINSAKGLASTVLYGGSTDDEKFMTLYNNYIYPFFNAKWWGGSWSAVDGATDEASAAAKVYEATALAGYDWKDLYDGHPATQGAYHPDETYVVNFKITGTWNDGNMSVLETEEGNGDPRTVVVTGTWNVTENQGLGGGSKVIVANGGKIVISEGVSLSAVNQAQFVVLRGGEISGKGELKVTNGNAEGEGNYNAGTINVGKFNNNFGRFFNYGTLKADVLAGGSQESSIYNHSICNIGSTFETGENGPYEVAPNTRIYNGCQFYCKNDMRIRNYEGVMGSALIVGGQFMPFGGTDGTTDPSYVSLAAGALVKCTTLYNGSNWTGPTEGGYGALEITQEIVFLTWEQAGPQYGGYFANNLYVKCATWTNDPDGQGKHFDGPVTTEQDQTNYDESRAEYKFWSCAANCIGNGHVTKVTDSNNVLFDASEGFVLGEKECTPGFKGTPEEDDDDEDDDITYTGRIMAEDLSVNQSSDWDFNDVVFDYAIKDDKAYILLQAAGGTLPLNVGGTLNADGEVVGGYEVHAAFGLNNTTTMVNTGAGATHAPVPLKLDNKTYTSDTQIQLFVKKKVDGVEKWMEIPGVKGEPAGKFVTTTLTNWVDEFANIKYAYGNFTQWVQNGTGQFAGADKNELYFDRTTRNEAAPATAE